MTKGGDDMAILDLQTLELSAEAERGGGKSGASKSCASGLSLLIC
jgi:hypothetical protein